MKYLKIKGSRLVPAELNPELVAVGLGSGLSSANWGGQCF